MKGHFVSAWKIIICGGSNTSTQREITYNTGETSELTGASQKQIRYWESRGYFQPYRNVCGRIAYRRFAQGQVEIIRAIKGHLARGYTLARAAELAMKGKDLNSE